MNIKSSVFFLIAMMTSTTALPCSYYFPSLAEFGPALWDGRSDVPANWAFIYTDIGSDGVSWWSRKLPDGEFQRLLIEPTNGLVRIRPAADFEPGETYEVFSSRMDGGALTGESALEESVLTGSFTVIDAVYSEPTQPTVLSSQVADVFEPFGNTCDEGVQDYSVPYLLVRIEEQTAVIVLRDLSTDRVLSTNLVFDRTDEGGLHGGRFEEPAVLSYQVESYDFAGNVSSVYGSIEVRRGISCSSTIAADSSIPISLSAFLVLGLLLSGRTNRRRRAET